MTAIGHADTVFRRDLAPLLYRNSQRWGFQHHPDGTETFHEATRDHYQRVVDRKAAAGTVTWADILLEEVYEALAEADDTLNLRAELLDVIAVSLAWIRDLDAGVLAKVPDSPAELVDAAELVPA